MYTCVYVYIYTYICISTYIQRALPCVRSPPFSVGEYDASHIYIYTYIYIHTYIYIYICKDVHIYTCIYAYIHIRMYILGAVLGALPGFFGQYI